jgi:hypothetical protein
MIERTQKTKITDMQHDTRQGRGSKSRAGTLEEAS